jgi:hypothetical protein
MAIEKKFEDMHTIQIIGKYSWEVSKDIIQNFYFKGNYFGGKFLMNVSNTKNSFGFLSYIHSKKDLDERFNFIEKNHVKEGGLFNVAFYNVYVNKLDKKNIKKIKKESYQLV